MKFTTKRLCLAAVFMALNVVLSSFGVPVPGGKIYLNGIVICFASLFLDPFSAFAVGGVGAYLGDLFFYPAPRYVSLIVRGASAVAISLISGGYKQKAPEIWRAVVAVCAGAVISICGYTFGKYFYVGQNWWGYATAKLPFQIAQDVICPAISVALIYLTPLKKYAFACAKKDCEKEVADSETVQKNDR